MRTILHSDCNSFYASVECLHRPELRGKPVAVGGDPEQRHGIILAKNQLARGRGVETGEALWQARQKCPELVILPPDFPLYLRFSRLAREIYLEYTSRVEPFGLDEAWLDVTGSVSPGEGPALAEEIRRRVKRELGITVSIGVSYNKVFAKLGSDYKKPDAVTPIGRDVYKSLVWPLPAGDLLCVGPATRRRLSSYGIHTIGDLARAPLRLLRSLFGKWGELLHGFANGLDTSPVAEYGEQPPVKSIGNSVTAPRDLLTGEDVRIVLFALADSVGRRLREQGLKGRVVSVAIRDAGLFSFSRQETLPHYTNITGEILEAGFGLFQKHYRWEKPVRSIGLHISQLAGDTLCTQASFFRDEGERLRMERLDAASDGLKRRFGSQILLPASQLADRRLSRIDPKNDHIIHPVGFF